MVRVGDSLPYEANVAWYRDDIHGVGEADESDSDPAEGVDDDNLIDATDGDGDNSSENLDHEDKCITKRHEEDAKDGLHRVGHRVVFFLTLVALEDNSIEGFIAL